MPSAEAYVRAVALGWGIGVAAWPLVSRQVERGELQVLHPHVAIDIALHGHQWKLLDRIGAALASGAQGLEPMLL